MGAQIIKRKIGERPEVITIFGKAQISYNSDGHIVIRYIDSPDEDTLIVLDATTSMNLKYFIQEILR